jgi:hypothetical protein
MRNNNVHGRPQRKHQKCHSAWRLQQNHKTLVLGVAFQVVVRAFRQVLLPQRPTAVDLSNGLGGNKLAYKSIYISQGLLIYVPYRWKYLIHSFFALSKNLNSSTLVGQFVLP